MMPSTRPLWIALWILLLSVTAQAAVPNRSLTFVALPGADTAIARASAAAVAQHAQRRLGLNPRKVHVLDQTPSPAAFIELFRRGDPFQYVSQGDLVVVYIAGAQTKRAGLKLSEGVLRWADLGAVGRFLRMGPGDDLGFFDGTVLLVLDRGPGRLPQFKLDPQSALLDLAAPRAPAVDPRAPAPELNDPVAVAGRGALADGELPPHAKVTPGAITWVGALEGMLAETERDGLPEHLVARAKAARPATGVRATFRTGRGYAPIRFRLLLQRLRVVLHPRLLRNVETLALLDELKRQLDRAIPPELKGQVIIERSDRADPTAHVSCQALANETRAHLECVEGRAPIFADRIDVTRPDEALAPVVRQILRDYKALAATNWSDRRRDLKPLDVVVLLDTSLSMAYHDPTSRTDPSLVAGPAKREMFLSRLAATMSTQAELSRRPARLTVLLFGETVRPLALPGAVDGTVTFKKRLSGATLAAYGAIFRQAASPQPYTGISAALTAAVTRLVQGPEGASRHVVLLTDGRESMETVQPDVAVARAAQAVGEVGASLHIVGLTEAAGRLPAYLNEMRAGGEVLKRYVSLLDMVYAPVECRRAAGWDQAQARTCGAFYAGIIEQSGAYDPALLDRIRRSTRRGVPTGVFLQPDSIETFQIELQALLTTLTGGGIYLTRRGERGAAKAGSVRDTWRLDLNLDGPARVVLYNTGALTERTYTVEVNDEPIGAAEGVRFVDQGDAVTVVTLPAPARGTWTITREGRLP